MSTDIEWEWAKDPNDKAWYGIPFPFDIATLTGVTVMETGPVDFSHPHHWKTPGDTVVDAQGVEATQLQIGTDNRTVMMRMLYGKPQHFYAVQAHVIDADGNEINRTSILKVSGR